jgi:hypothetical protein
MEFDRKLDSDPKRLCYEEVLECMFTCRRATQEAGFRGTTGAWAAEMVVSPLVAAAILVTLKAFPPKNDVLAAPTLLATLLQDHKWKGHVKQPFPPPPPPAIAGGNSTSTQLKSPHPSH